MIRIAIVRTTRDLRFKINLGANRTCFAFEKKSFVFARPDIGSLIQLSAFALEWLEKQSRGGISLYRFQRLNYLIAVVKKRRDESQHEGGLPRLRLRGD